MRSFAACLSHLTIDYAALSRRSTFLTFTGDDTSNIWVITAFLPCVIRTRFGYPILFIVSAYDADTTTAHGIRGFQIGWLHRNRILG